MTDPLIRVPVEKWLELKSILDKDWPRCIQSETLDIHRVWTEKGIKHEFEVYCPNGDFHNGMVSINKKLSCYEVIVSCPSEDTSAMEEALKKTKVVEWKNRIEFLFVPQNVLDCIKRVVSFLGIELVASSKMDMFILQTGSQLFDLCIPEDLTFGPLYKDQVDLINDVWPHQYKHSKEYFEFLIEADPGYGLYKDEELVGWVFIRENGPLLHLYVLKEHRRKGYGELILKFISNELLKRNKDVLAYCIVGNYTACKMYQKLNFKSHGFVGSCYSKSIK